MSEQQPQPPESDQPTPAVSPLKSQSSNPVAELGKVAQSIWRRGQPVVVSVGTKLLEVTLVILNRVQQQLEKEAIKPRSTNSGSESTPAAERSSGKKVAPKSRPQSPGSSEETSQQVLNRLQEVWLIVLGLVRSRLPKPLRRLLPDGVLTALISGVLLTILWLTTFGFPSLPKATAKAPEEITPPPQLVAPRRPTPIAVETPQPEPPPDLQLPPEQTLIAQIQEQVSEVTDRYAAGLIQSVQANFKRSRLIVKVGAGWYDLENTQQDRLAQEVLQRTQKLEFEKLELTDSDGVVVARSPVVGDTVIILKRRSKPIDTSSPDYQSP